ncbi:hypothetical protein EYF80_051735 [Liparis tanakae]|uniref:Uncharacterized protein n=1 Tax=Liparis tanakae TaxID=230148 RepID=A0A4Z2FBF0_9TELE|nr:hypothetical protein EYF80_051735 [Liparis tanakae]
MTRRREEAEVDADEVGLVQKPRAAPVVLGTGALLKGAPNDPSPPPSRCRARFPPPYEKVAAVGERVDRDVSASPSPSLFPLICEMRVFASHSAAAAIALSPFSPN